MRKYLPIDYKNRLGYRDLDGEKTKAIFDKLQDSLQNSQGLSKRAVYDQIADEFGVKYNTVKTIEKHKGDANPIKTIDEKLLSYATNSYKKTNRTVQSLADLLGVSNRSFYRHIDRYLEEKEGKKYRRTLDPEREEVRNNGWYIGHLLKSEAKEGNKGNGKKILGKLIPYPDERLMEIAHGLEANFVLSDKEIEKICNQFEVRTPTEELQHIQRLIGNGEPVPLSGYRLWLEANPLPKPNVDYSYPIRKRRSAWRTIRNVAGIAAAVVLALYGSLRYALHSEPVEAVGEQLVVEQSTKEVQKADNPTTTDLGGGVLNHVLSSPELSELIKFDDISESVDLEMRASFFGY